MPSDPQAVLARHVTKRDIICEECLGLWPCDTAVVARALAESEERVRVLEAALGDWDAKAKAETDTSLHRMGHRDDPMAQQADNFAAEALYAAEDRLHSLVDPEWAALSEPETPR